MKKLGLLVNPIAGMGGAVGLKGTDGEEVLGQAITLGAKPISPKRSTEYLSALRRELQAIELHVGPGQMGELEALEVALDFTVVGGPLTGKTSAADTRRVADSMERKGVDLLVFCGGDGTARDILDSIDQRVVSLGIPSGVKMHSSVFAVTPVAAAALTIEHFRGRATSAEREVMDIDEDAYRQGRLSARLYGYLRVPFEPSFIQGTKEASLGTQSEREAQYSIAKRIVEEMNPDTYYVLGPGTTIKAITDYLGLQKTVLGIDIIRDRKLVLKDVNEGQILRILADGQSKVIVTPIGGQGFIFGRGNQQISAEVLRRVGKGGVVVVATRTKINAIPGMKLRIDTGDLALDAQFAGYVRVVVDYNEEIVMKVDR